MNRAGGTTQSFTKPDASDWVLHITTVLDTQTPSVPTGVNAVATSATSVQVTWSESTDNVGISKYIIYRNGSQVGTSTTTSFTNSGLSPSTTYSYTVAAKDAAGNTSAQSSPPAVATILQLDTLAPSVPTGVTGTALSTSSIRINWTASTDNVRVTGYRVYRNGTEVGTPTATSYTDSGLTGGTTYFLYGSSAGCFWKSFRSVLASSGSNDTPDRQPAAKCADGC